MKKFLSMVLVLTMTLSLVTVSSGAANFTDAAGIDYKEAVDVMTAVGVVNGYVDGSFGPDGYLTRGAAAKIICNLILGPTTAEALAADTAPYSDVPTSNVFAGYIAYCQKEGIINGYADGTFRPGNSLTGYAFMKMLLGALGYDAVKEGYTGNNWSINVAKQAINLGLEDGLDGEFNGINTVTRQEALLYAFNAMQTTMVEYPNNSTIIVGDVTVSTNSTAAEMTSNNKVDYNGSEDGKLQFCEKYFPKLSVTSGRDDFGRPANTWKHKNETIGTYGRKADLVYKTDAKIFDIRKALGISGNEYPKFTIQINTDITAPNAAGDYDTYWNTNLEGKTYAMPTAAGNDSYKNLSHWLGGIMNVEKNGQEYSFDNAYFKYYYGGSDIFFPTYGGTTTEVYYDAETKTGTIVVIEEQIGEIASVKTDDNGRYVTVKKGDGSSAVQSSWKFYTDAFAKGDVVLFTVGKYADDGKGNICTMQAADMVSGTVNYINGSTYVVIDGVGYNMYSNNWVGNFDFNAGDEVDAYLTSDGRIISIVVTDASSDVSGMVLIEKIGDKDILGNRSAIVIYGDGTREVVTLYADYTGREYQISGYSMVNGKLKLKNLSGYEASTEAAEGVTFTKGTATMGDIRVDAGTTFVYIDENGNTKTYVGFKHAPSIVGEGATVVALHKEDAKAASLVYVWVDSSDLGSSTSNDYVLAITDKYYKWSTVDADGVAQTYYAIRTLSGEYLYIDASATNGSGVALYADGTNDTDVIYDAYYQGVVVFDSLTYDNNTGYVTEAKTRAEVNILTASGSNASAEHTVEYKNGVLYINGTAYAPADETTVYVVAHNGDSFETVNIADLDDTYVGFVIIGNDNNEAETIVLKEMKG